MKTILGKKAHWFNVGEYSISFKTEANFLKFWKKCLQNTNYHNFADEPSNWASFCRNDKMHFRPQWNSLSITVSIFHEQQG